ncbi:chemotaxis protein CheD [Ohtaekwangia koreensis]|uniref:Chemotaxis protein CheD n=1 Tax=Ohtaekwangia koreensis TaxID=688867 RepID=A0A1T5JSC2_9BACT|nr:chemotaxis protein CheD [Ohtaekwangia koreensis]SKC54300.1 chemotaxis protein CheD [Ohtaekwangia koreensis]
MMSHILNINDIAVSAKPVELVCFGLGSCIGLFVTDRIKKVSGGVHIPLPGGTTGIDMKGADELLEQMLQKVQSKGGNLNRLRAKVTGGSSILSHENAIGEQNALSVVQLLQARKIYIAATDLGGNVSRSVRFNSVTQELIISTSTHEFYKI